MEHEMLMPGMLTEEQMHQLDQARGAEFDRLFLTFMIQHHKGAVSMVKDLFGSYGAAQDETVFKFATDVSVDQSTEIARMEKMLARPSALPAPRDPQGTRHGSRVAPIRCRSLLGLAAVAALRSLRPRARATCPPTPPSPDPRVGLKAGLFDAGEATWNLKRAVEDAAVGEVRRRSPTPTSRFTGKYAIQGNYNGYQVWDISNPAQADARDGVRLPGVAERRVGLQEPAVRLGRGLSAPARLRHRGRARTR